MPHIFLDLRRVQRKEEAALEEALGSIRHFEKSRSGKAFLLAPFVQALKKLGSPQKSFRSIQVLGTNGKGSTALFFAHLLSFSERVGLYLSPHAFTFRERIQTVDHGKFQRIAYSQLSAQIERVNRIESQTLPLSPFEKLTAAALLYFQEAGVSWAVLEAGLGGRLDATSCTSSELQLFTPIALDHTQVLGNTIAAIAKEKGEALRRKGIAYSLPQPPAAAAALKAIAARREASLTFLPFAKPSLRVTSPQHALLLPLAERAILFPSFSCSLAQSFSFAAEAYKHFVQKPLPHFTPIPLEALPGRRTLLRCHPPLLWDAAHNPHAIAHLVADCREAFPHLRFQVFFGTLSDKDYRSMLASLQEIASHFYFPKLPPPFRPAQDLLKASSRKVPADLFPSSRLSQALPLLLTGSFRLLAQAAPLLENGA